MMRIMFLYNNNRERIVIGSILNYYLALEEEIPNEGCTNKIDYILKTQL